MSGNVFRYHKKTYVMSSNNFHKVMDRSHMASSETKDFIEEWRMEVILGGGESFTNEVIELHSGEKESNSTEAITVINMAQRDPLQVGDKDWCTLYVKSDCHSSQMRW